MDVCHSYRKLLLLLQPPPSHRIVTAGHCQGGDAIVTVFAKHCSMELILVVMVHIACLTVPVPQPAEKKLLVQALLEVVNHPELT